VDIDSPSFNLFSPSKPERLEDLVQDPTLLGDQPVRGQIRRGPELFGGVRQVADFLTGTSFVSSVFAEDLRFNSRLSDGRTESYPSIRPCTLSSDAPSFLTLIINGNRLRPTQFGVKNGTYTNQFSADNLRVFGKQ
jgi:hypothetical protein